VIPVSTPDLTGNEAKYLQECIRTGWISSEGPFVEQFEKRFAEQVNRRFGMAVSNGSAALEIAIAALNIGPGDEVILPTFTIISCAAAVVRAGATPVLIDSDPLTWNMDVAQIEARITPRSKAIMAVHTYGLPVDMEPVLALARKYDLNVIEDAAEAHGLNYKDKSCGSFGDISTFSFYPNKLVTTGEGGMVLTNNKALADRCRSLRNLCFQPQKRFVHEELGWNFRMSNIQAALGLAQLERLDYFIAKKRHIGRLYTQLLKDITDIQLPLLQTDYSQNIYWVYGLIVGEKVPDNAGSLIQQLAKSKIGTRPFFWPMHRQPVFQKMGLFHDETYPAAENLSQRGFYIPSGVTLTDRQIETVSQAVRNIIK
jgi:perosamine synthetase